jgi:negative regulator of sigma E activity
MNDTWAPTLSRLLDDDEVDLETLAAALEDPEGRQLLVQFAGLRNAVRRDDVTVSAAFRERMDAFGPARLPRKRWRYELAAMLAAGLLLGLAADTWLDRAANAPPAASRVLRFEAGEWTSAQGGGL